MRDAAPSLRDTPEISVVIPCRNEEANARAIAAAVIAELEMVGCTFDVLFIDNASSDATVAIISELCAADPRIRLIVNTRDFGQMRSPTHAIFQARGRAVIAMCADFQDPPTLIPEFIARWRAGADIVLGVRQSERSSPLLAASRRLSYALQRRFGDYPIIPNATGFGLYDARVVRSIERFKEPEPFFRGLLVETGYTIQTIPHARPPRAGGKSNNNVFALLDFALSGLAASSRALLRAPLYVGIVAMILTGGTLLAALIAALMGASAIPWLIASGIELQFALIFLFLGLIGVQLRLVSDRTRETPLVIERERINFPPGY